MPRETTLLLGVSGQSVSIDTPEGRPSSVTVAIYDPRYEEDATDQPIASTTASTITATASTINTTLDAAAGVSQSDPRRVPLTATTGCVDGIPAKIAEDSDLRSELVEINAVASADYVSVREPLEFDYTSGATFVGIRTTAAIASTLFDSTGWLGKEENLGESYRVKWTLVIGGTTYVRRTYFDLVRIGPPQSVSVLDVLPLFPDGQEQEWFQQAGKRFEPQLAWSEATVRDDLRALGYRLDRTRGTNTLMLLVGAHFRWLLASLGRVPSNMNAVVQMEIWRAEYDRRLAQIKVGQSRFAHDTDDSGVLSEGERKQFAPQAGLVR
jgi:hypothetical protein